MSRIAATFAKTKAQNRAALVTYIMAADPDYGASLEIMNALPKAGADIIELGIAFTDPMADGPAIQEAARRALHAGAKVATTLEMLAAFRRKDANTPVILMGYSNPLYAYGFERFCTDAAKAGADGLIIVDIPLEEEAEFRPVAKAAGLELIRLIAPTSHAGNVAHAGNGARSDAMLKDLGGFIYYITIAGVTGTKSANIEEVRAQVKAIQAKTNVPVAIGFGIKTAEQARDAAAFADAVVVGSALVQVIKDYANSNDLIPMLTGKISALAEALKRN